ncbi:nucleoside 2-deoxyribosyltransferase [Companilactobacillus mishanensis]|uniref:nucleoside 2-deoxyribosyltransferase n=1 Tax=Companilactobacillus mishanensis TaxID=2486008 RepID=UPI001296AECD|nr:nucleoside 2-deoxyribosyltransferase [Companilactobacillus mishanensis]MQS88211.1 nucleoside 2-deoxyribosyltransferase [Companilactobacillus mishanensis]
MKIYFAGSIRGGRENVEIYRELIEFLNQNNEVLTKHIGDKDLSVDGQTELSDAEIRKRDIDWMKEADLVIAETSNPSLGVGYELAYAEKINKPVLILHNKRTKLSAMINGTEYFKDINYYFSIEEARHILGEKVQNYL